MRPSPLALSGPDPVKDAERFTIRSGSELRGAPIPPGCHVQDNELPPDVQKFLHAHIASYEQLELLLALRGDQARSWTEEALCERLSINPASLRGAVEGLQSGHFLATRAQGGESYYSYLPQREDVEATIGRLAATYREYPIPIIKHMSANAIERLRSAALRTFADAFILRKDKDRG